MNPRLRFPQRAGQYRPAVSPFSSRFVGVLEVWKISDAEMEPYPFRVALALRKPANQRSASSGIGVSMPCGAILTRGITGFAPRLLEL